MTDKNRQFDDEMCERYLLGELSEAEQARFEEAYFADDALFEQYLAVKDDLTDAFARNELDEEKRKRFAKHFSATAPRRRKIDETREFIRAVSAVSAVAAVSKKKWRQSFAEFFSARRLAWQFALAAVLLVALGGFWVFVVRQPQTPDEQAVQNPTPAPTIPLPTNENTNTPNINIATPSPSPTKANGSPVNSNSTPQPTPKSPTKSPTRFSPVQFATVVLMPVAPRDINESNTLRITSDTRAVRLRLVFKSGDYRNYSAAITTIEGASIWQTNNLKPSGKTVTLQLAPTLLRGQDYIITLTGKTADGQTETIGEYYFRVERSQSQNTQTPKTQP